MEARARHLMKIRFEPTDDHQIVTFTILVNAMKPMEENNFATSIDI